MTAPCQSCPFLGCSGCAYQWRVDQSGQETAWHATEAAARADEQTRRANGVREVVTWEWGGA